MSKHLCELESLSLHRIVSLFSSQTARIPEEAKLFELFCFFLPPSTFSHLDSSVSFWLSAAHPPQATKGDLNFQSCYLSPLTRSTADCFSYFMFQKPVAHLEKCNQGVIGQQMQEERVQNKSWQQAMPSLRMLCELTTVDAWTGSISHCLEKRLGPQCPLHKATGHRSQNSLREFGQHCYSF